MRFIHGESLPYSGEFSGFSGHKDKSSNIAVIPTGGILRKEKGRNMENSWYELVSLYAWDRLLSAHNDGTDSDLHVHSPKPYGLDDEGRIYMEFLRGVSTDAAISGNFERGKGTPTKYELRVAMGKKLGRLMRIKDIEGLAHFDFQLRHLIQGVHDRSLGVIDVENSKIDPKKVKAEHRKIQAQIKRTLSQSPRLTKQFQQAWETGYESKIDDYPIMGDVISDLRKDLDLPVAQVDKLLTANES